MHCSDCGSSMAEVAVKDREGHLCGKCGAFFGDSETVNRLDSFTLSTWRRVRVDPRWLSMGSGKCPLDGTIMQRYFGDAVPAQMNVKRCTRCGKWWFSGDTLHEFKPAQEAKQQYFRLWGITTSMGGLLLPMLALVMSAAVLAMTVYLAVHQQSLGVPAFGGR